MSVWKEVCRKRLRDWLAHRQTEVCRKKRNVNQEKRFEYSRQEGSKQKGRGGRVSTAAKAADQSGRRDRLKCQSPCRRGSARRAGERTFRRKYTQAAVGWWRPCSPLLSCRGINCAPGEHRAGPSHLLLPLGTPVGERKNGWKKLVSCPEFLESEHGNEIKISCFRGSWIWEHGGYGSLLYYLKVTHRRKRDKKGGMREGGSVPQSV